MNGTQKLVLTLLIISLVMSAVSIAINVAILKVDLGQPRITPSSQTSSSSSGRIGLYVEEPPSSGGP